MSGLYDPKERAIAAALEQQHHPRWAIWWGVGSHRFWAVPCWKGAPVPIVDAPDARRLLADMRQVEAGKAPGWRTLATSGKPA
jgi:hypothetical protein